MTQPLVWAALSAGLTAAAWILVKAWRPLAERWNLIDIPNERSSHTRPMPRSGGVPVVLLTLAAIAATPAFSNVGWRAAAALAAASGCIAATGFIDDFRSLSWRTRFAIQLIVALALVSTFGTIGQVGPLPLGLLAYPLTVMWLAGLTNAYNFMDGIDGIAGIQAVVAATGWAMIGAMRGDSLMAVAGIALAATAAGFLIHNWPPATIFMGDVASGFLGFLFAALTVRLAQADPNGAIVGALFVCPFLVDTMTTFFRRLRRRENVFSAHRSHIYQRLVIAGASHARVSAFYGLLALLCTAAGIAIARGWRAGTALAIVAAGGTAAVLWTAVTIAERARR